MTGQDAAKRADEIKAALKKVGARNDPFSRCSLCQKDWNGGEGHDHEADHAEAERDGDFLFIREEKGGRIWTDYDGMANWVASYVDAAVASARREERVAHLSKERLLLILSTKTLSDAYEELDVHLSAIYRESGALLTRLHEVEGERDEAQADQGVARIAKAALQRKLAQAEQQCDYWKNEYAAQMDRPCHVAHHEDQEIALEQAEQRVAGLEAAIRQAANELGVVQPGYPMPVANACNILRAALTPPPPSAP